MEGNDIGVTIHKHIACMFEGVIMYMDEPEDLSVPTKWWQRHTRPEVLSHDQYIRAHVRRWKPNDLPLKSVYHMVNNWDLGVEVYTFLHPDFVPEIEHWLARKGVAVRVFAYDGIRDLAQDFRYNRDVHTFFTTSEDDAALVGIRATVVRPDGTFGI